MPILPKTYFLGASGAGKTTLARYVSETLGLPLLSGATALAREECGLTFDDIINDPKAAAVYQLAVFRHQQALEAPYWKSDEAGFVSDRGIDLLAYTAELADNARQILFGDAMQEHLTRVRHKALVFFVRPHPEVKAPKDGRRDMFLDPDCVHRVDGVVQFLLHAYDIPHVPITFPRLRDRMRLVHTVVKGRIQR